MRLKCQRNLRDGRRDKLDLASVRLHVLAPGGDSLVDGQVGLAAEIELCCAGLSVSYELHDWVVRIYR